MRVVLDTNVFISGLLSRPGGTTYRIRKAWENGEFEVCISEYQIAEIRRKLNTAFQDVVTKQERAELISLIRKACTLLEPRSRRNLSKDPDDSPLIDLAIEAGAEYLVSGDPDVLKVSHKNLKVLTPASFLKQIKK